MTNIELFRTITDNMNSLYAAKNHDYGDSFTEQMNEDGLIYLKGKLGDKYNRLKSFVHKNELHVKQESIEDTLIDIACYAVMGLCWLKNNSINETNNV